MTFSIVEQMLLGKYSLFIGHNCLKAVKKQDNRFR